MENKTVAYPEYSTAERWADGIVHVIGVSLASFGVYYLVSQAISPQHPMLSISLGIYSVGLLLMLVASAAYHMAAYTEYRPLLRRIDHAAIYLKIAATLTPMAILANNTLCYGLLAIVWMLSLTGAVRKFCAKPGKMTTGWLPQLCLGWLGIAVLIPLAKQVQPQTLWCFLFGGLVYSSAIIFYCWEKLRFANALWHCFVVIASAFMYFGIASAVSASGKSTNATQICLQNESCQRVSAD